MLQNQRPKKTLYRIDFNGNLYRIILDGLAQKVMNFDVFQSSDLDFVACKNLPCQILCLWKVLDFVDSRILAGRAEFDLVIGPFGTWPWGPLQNRGAQQGPPNCKGDVFIGSRDANQKLCQWCQKGVNSKLEFYPEHAIMKRQNQMVAYSVEGIWWGAYVDWIVCMHVYQKHQRNTNIRLPQQDWRFKCWNAYDSPSSCSIKLQSRSSWSLLPSFTCFRYRDVGWDDR